MRTFSTLPQFSGIAVLMPKMLEPSVLWVLYFTHTCTHTHTHAHTYTHAHTQAHTQTLTRWDGQQYSLQFPVLRRHHLSTTHGDPPHPLSLLVLRAAAQSMGKNGFRMQRIIHLISSLLLLKRAAVQVTGMNDFKMEELSTSSPLFFC